MYAVLDADGVKRYFASLGDGTVSSPYRTIPMDYERAVIDLGLLFVHSDRHTIANNGVFSYLINTPASPSHVELLELRIATTSAPMYVDLFENTVVTANGTAEGLLNLNRQLLTSAGTLLYMSPTYSAGAEGTKITEGIIHGEKSIGGIGRERDRMILKPSYNYLIKMQNVSGASANVAIKLIIGED